jgi:hypothetical protein
VHATRIPISLGTAVCAEGCTRRMRLFLSPTSKGQNVSGETSFESNATLTMRFSNRGRGGSVSPTQPLDTLFTIESWDSPIDSRKNLSTSHRSGYAPRTIVPLTKDDCETRQCDSESQEVYEYHMYGPDVSQLVILGMFPDFNISHDLRDVNCEYWLCNRVCSNLPARLPHSSCRSVRTVPPVH